MKKITKNVSPFLLLTLPFFVLLAVMAGYGGNEIITEKIQLSASFFKLPAFDVLFVYFFGNY